MKAAELRASFLPVGRKMGRQMLKDYIVFPLLAGPFFLTVLLGNLAANVLRSIWTFVIIFCGHFTADAEVFPKESIRNESRGHWYLRQLRGSSNLTGGKLMNVLSGNLSHQIEHHFYPTCRPPLRADCGRGEAGLCALRPALQHRLAAASVRPGDVADRAARVPEPAQAGTPPTRRRLAERLIERAAIGVMLFT